MDHFERLVPDLIEIVPLEKPVEAGITIPGSKSITNRALILAALAEGETTLEGALWSEDTQWMLEGLRKLGFELDVKPDPEETCNWTIKVKGQGGRIPNGGTEHDPLQIFVGNAGTAARFLAPLVCLGHGVYRLHGVPRMHERPQAALLRALRQLGYRVDSANDRLPVAIYGSGPRHGKCDVSIEESSQFASGLLMCAQAGGWEVNVTGENSEESPYVEMTKALIQQFRDSPGEVLVEPDASSGSYFFGAQFLAPQPSNIDVRDWPYKSRLQVDAAFFAFPFMGHKLSSVSRIKDLGDSIMTLIVLAPWFPKPAQFTDLGRLRLQECERVVALRAELTKCGAKVIETGDTLSVFPSKLHGAEIETYGDHRMAMCFAMLGLKVPGIKIRDPGCVKKTFPNFFLKLAAPSPAGLGVTILDATSGRKLGLAELFAPDEV
jgi:3-phosphoshikimate 1-carboxyvinyltransferase